MNPHPRNAIRTTSFNDTGARQSLVLRCFPKGVAMPRTAGLLLCALTLLACPLTAAAQARWVPPRTSDGQPDLQGVWLSNTATPLERPKQLEGKARLSDEEVAEFRRRADRLFKTGNSDFAVGDGVFQAVLTNPDRYTNPNSTHSASDMVDLEFDNRTSLITDPSDGRLPPVTPEGRNRQVAVNAAFQRPASPADVGNALRCVSWGVPRLGGRYGAGDMILLPDLSVARIRGAVHGSRP